MNTIRENLLAWALHVAAQGWHVFPITPGPKNHQASTGGRPGRHRPRPDQPPELPPDEQDTTTVVAPWKFTGLALSTAARARERRQAAQDAA